jgi:serine/threonine-protein kinase
MIGQTISHYKILEKLGEGGMGVVYKALDTKLNRMVALKFLPRKLTVDETEKIRFAQEAQLAATLNHPNVCTIYDIVEHDGEMFIAMEFVDGQTLREKKGSISFRQATDIGIQIADGLAAAHEKGIVHRDIKPENIMIRKDGIAQIMDFGLAKLRGNVSRLTKEGSTVGTAGYMSPEQVQGQDADHRSDIFSFGVLLFELFTGQTPFKGVHETALAYEIVNVDAPPMSSVKPEIDPALDAIVLECLEKDPNERTQSVKQVSIDLKRFKRESSRSRVSRITAAIPVRKPETGAAPSAPDLPPRRSYIWPAVAGVLAIALIAAVWMLWRAPVVTLPTARFRIMLPKDQTINIITHTAIAISPDGSRIVYAAKGKLYQRRMESFDPEPIAGTDDGSSPFFSPDGRWVGFFGGGKLKKVAVAGGVPVGLADMSDNRGGTWTKDGTIIYSPSGRGGLFRIRSDGGEPQQLTTVDSAQNERTHRWPQCLPDGKTVLFIIGKMDSPDYYEDAAIASVNLETGARKIIMKGASTVAYLPTGYLVYSHSGILFSAPFDADRLEVTGMSFPVVENIGGDPTTGATDFSFASNGTLAYIPGLANITNRQLAFIDLNGTVSTLPAPVQQYMEPALSPDGGRVAVVIGSGKDEDIWVFDIQTKTMSRLTFGGPNRSPVWSPDGKRIAYSYNQDGDPKLIIRAADGSGTPEEIKVGYGRTYVTCWSRDGATLIFTGIGTGGGWDIAALRLDGDRKPIPILATKFDEMVGSLSPDGRWLAYLSNETGSSQAYIRPFPEGGGKWQISTERAFQPHWSGDGKTLYYETENVMRAVSISGTESPTIGQRNLVLKEIPQLSLESGVTYDLAPDGQRFLVTKVQEGNEIFQQIAIVLNWFDDIRAAAAQAK